MQEDHPIEEYVKSEGFYEDSGEGWRGKMDDFLRGVYFVPTALVLVAIIAFCLGRISGLQEKRPPVRVVSGSSGEVRGASIAPQITAAGSEKVVASKNGTKYHYASCTGAKQISAQNLITFNSIERGSRRRLYSGFQLQRIKIV